MFYTIIDILQSSASNPLVKEAALGLLLIILLIVRVRYRRRRDKSKWASAVVAPGKIRSADDPHGPEKEDFDTAPEPPAPAPEPIAPVMEEPDVASTVDQKAQPLPVEPVRLMDRLKNGLNKTRRSLTGRLESVFSENHLVSDTVLEEIEEILITSDVGMQTTMALIRRIEEQAASISDLADLKRVLKEEMLQFLDTPPPRVASGKPHVIMVVGVNGVGKTTTIGKLAARYRAQGKTVLLGAADTFRAAAVEQLEVWADRTGAEIVRHRDKADPAAVAFDSLEAAIARGIDVLIIDTAGRLHTKVNLMEQLKKIKRSLDKRLSGAPHDVLLVLDATTGQNAVSQAKLFNEGISITSIALTKLDGTAKGGIVISICNELKLPLTYIGVGESIEDLQVFEPKSFIDALF